MLHPAVREFDVGRDRCGELDKPMVEKRYARLESVSHRDAVLDMKQCRQQGFEIEVGHRIEVRLLVHVVAVKDLPETVVRGIVAQEGPIDLCTEVWRSVDEAE